MRRFPLLALCFLAFPSWGQVSENVTQLGTQDLYNEYNDIWGYADEFGSEFAILGTDTGTSIVDVTIPGSPVETGFIAGAPSIWRDMKTYGDYAYVVTEGATGYLQIIDLSDPANPVELGAYMGFETAHNIFIDEAGARAYVCGMDIAGGGVHVLDLSNPAVPVALGDWSTTYVHDLYVRNHIGYLAEIFEPSFTVVDFSNPASISVLGGPVSYTNAFTHNTWLDGSGDILFTTDENAGGHVQLWDVSALPAAPHLGDFRVGPSGAIVHNVLIAGDLGFVSYYTEGLRIFEFSDPTAPAEVGYYDTHAPPGTGYVGAWGVYPYLPSGNILVSDIEDGLHVFALGDAYGMVQGVVSEDGVGTPLEGAQLEILENGKQYSTGAAGSYTIATAPGAYTLRASLLGFAEQEIPFNVAQGATTPLNISLVRLPSSPLSGYVRGKLKSGQIVNLVGAEIELVDAGYDALSAADGSWSITQVPHGSYDLRVRRPGFGQGTLPIVVASGDNAQDILLEQSEFYDNADSDLGWTLGVPSDTANLGLWIRAVPVPSDGGNVQPGYDATPGTDGGNCFVTGNAPTPAYAIGSEDVDNGNTTLISPSFDASSLNDPHLAYARWYVNEAGANPGQDVFTVEISNDDGNNWTLLEQLGNDHKPWTRVDFRIADFVAPSSTMRVRFIAEDAPFGSIVEALIDDFEVYGSYQAVVATPPSQVAPRGIQSAAPNPFNPRTRIQFAIERPGPAQLDIVDLRGRVVTTLVKAELDRGVYSEHWNGIDRNGAQVASGVYLAILRSADGRSMQKLSLVK